MDDPVLLLYSIFMGGILLFPFLYYHFRKNLDEGKNQNLFRVKLERTMLLENLRDLKTDFETGKFSESDFQNLSNDIIQKLEFIDREYPDLVPVTKCSCGEKKAGPDSKFCHICGKQLGVSRKLS